MRLYLPILAVFLCVLLDALASLPSGTDYYGRIKDATPVVTNAWQSVQKDVEGLLDARISGATNAVAETVASIVTNEVSEWVITADNPEISLDGWYIELSYVRNVTTGEKIAVWNINHDSHTWLSAEGFSYTNTEYEVAAERFNDINGNKIYDDGEEIITFTVRAERKNRNALGLAMAKDLERLPTHEAVTNTVRDNIGSVWDAQLGVAWQARMHNGHLYYIAVTNQPTGGK